MRLIAAAFTGPCPLFDLFPGQKRQDPVMDNALWFNHRGMFLQKGALDAADIRRIQENLALGEAFVIMRPHKSLDAAAQDLEYVASHAAYILTHDRLIHVDPDATAEDENFFRRNGLVFEVICLTEAFVLLDEIEVVPV
ncbi:MAG: hypothetical protein WC813_04525 [Patescibacteria group bacterium]